MNRTVTLTLSRDLDLNDLRFFVEVVDRGSFSSAAKSMGRPKSRVSRRIVALETSLSVRLLQRTSRSVALTEVGTDFYAHCRQMLDAAIAAEEAIRSRLSGPAGNIRLTCPVALSQTIIKKLLPRLMARYPLISIRLIVTNSVLDLVRERCDIALRVHRGSIADSSMIRRDICRLSRTLVAASAYIDQTGPVRTIEDLATRSCIAGPNESAAATWRFTDANGTVRLHAFSPTVAADDMMTAKTAVSAGLGVALLPKYVCRDELQSGTFVSILPEWEAEDVTVTMLVPSRQGILSSIRAIMDFLIDELPMALGERDPETSHVGSLAGP